MPVPENAREFLDGMRFVRGAKAIAYDHNGGYVDEVTVDGHGRLERPMSVPTGGSVVLQGYAFGPLRNAIQASTIAGVAQYVDRVEQRTFCPHGVLGGWTHCHTCKGDATMDDIAFAFKVEFEHHVLSAEDLQGTHFSPGPLNLAETPIPQPGDVRENCPHGRPTWRMCPHCLGITNLPSRAVQRPDGLWGTAPDTGASPGVQEALRPPGVDEGRRRVDSALETAYSAHYQAGYNHGLDVVVGRWNKALSEYCELPEYVNTEDPKAVAEYILLLQDQLKAARGGQTLGQTLGIAYDEAWEARMRAEGRGDDI